MERPGSYFQGLAERTCIGCHKINGEGGEAAPDLSNLGSRRSVDQMRSLITDSDDERPGLTRT